jgi:hypothetical protein
MQVDELVTATPPSRALSREFLAGEAGNFDRLRGPTGLCRGRAECRSPALDHAGTTASFRLSARICPPYPDQVTGSKEVRAEPFAARGQGSNVWLLAGLWHNEFLLLDELESFPRAGAWMRSMPPVEHSIG